MNLYVDNSDQKILHLPMFCRLSIKDVKENCQKYHKKGQDRSLKEPSSPKVSCIGQVKRNNRVISPTTAANHRRLRRHHTAAKPRKSSSSAFTSKTLFPNATNYMLSHSASRSCRPSIAGEGFARKSMVMRRDYGLNYCCRNRKVVVDDHRGDGNDYCVDVSNMDPPLPVVRRSLGLQGRCEAVNIWKRRFNGDTELRALKIEYDAPCAIFNRPPTTV